MERKPAPTPFWFEPKFAMDATHLEEIAHIAGPDAKLLIETKDYKLDGIEELTQYVHAPTELKSLKVQFAAGDTLAIVPHPHARGERATRIAPKIERIRSSARRWFNLRAAAIILALSQTLGFLFALAGYVSTGKPNWDMLEPRGSTVVQWMVSMVVALVYAAGLATNRIDPRRRKEGFWRQNREKILLAAVTTVIGGLITYVGVRLKDGL
jgi:hypothetical protein